MSSDEAVQLFQIGGVCVLAASTAYFMFRSWQLEEELKKVKEVHRQHGQNMADLIRRLWESYCLVSAYVPGESASRKELKTSMAKLMTYFAKVYPETQPPKKVDINV